jgi:hypothetical protein
MMEPRARIIMVNCIRCGKMWEDEMILPLPRDFIDESICPSCMEDLDRDRLNSEDLF